MTSFQVKPLLVKFADGGPKKKKNHQLNISTQWTTRRPDEVKCFIIPSGYISAIETMILYVGCIQIKTYNTIGESTHTVSPLSLESNIRIVINQNQRY